MMELVRQLAAVAFVLGLLGAAVLVLRRNGARGRPWKTRPAAALEILEQISLGPGHRLHLVRIAERAVLIGTHPSGCTLLDSLPSHRVAPPKEQGL